MTMGAASLLAPAPLAAAFAAFTIIADRRLAWLQQSVMTYPPFARMLRLKAAEIMSTNRLHVLQPRIFGLVIAIEVQENQCSEHSDLQFTCAAFSGRGRCERLQQQRAENE